VNTPTPFEHLVRTITQARTPQTTDTQQQRWRHFERLLVGYVKSHHIDVINEAGMPVIEVVRFREGEESVVTSRISIEHLARFLVRELAP
jgi:hypothetical protein